MLVKRQTDVKRSNRAVVTNKTELDETIFLYASIGGWSGIDAQEFVTELKGMTASTIHLRIDSDGGDVFAARAMKTAIMQHPATIIAHIDGVAASAASFLAMGADEIEIVDGGFIMIHKAMSFIDIFGYFNEDQLGELMGDIDREKGFHAKINDSIAADYVKRTGKTKDEVLAWMGEETWFTAEEAVENGFADRVYDGDIVEGSYHLEIYNNVPARLRDKSNSGLNPRDLERCLRDAGASKNQAKAILAKGLTGLDDREDQGDPPDSNLRDVDSPEGGEQDATKTLLDNFKLLA